jgi:cytoskeletal protein CcmA (bactofilin family)
MGIFNKSNEMAKDSSTTIISKGAKLKGEFNLTAKLHIEGEIEGNIYSSNQISVGKSGVIKGEIKCEEFILNGKFEGKIEANYVEITKEGFLKGDVVTKEFLIEKGGVFEGTSTLNNKVKEKNAGKKS